MGKASSGSGNGDKRTPGGAEQTTSGGPDMFVWRNTHKDRYGPTATNPKVDSQIAHLLAGVDKFTFNLLEDAADKSH